MIIYTIEGIIMVNLVDEIKAKITEQLKEGVKDAISSTIQNSIIGNIEISTDINLASLESKNEVH